MNTKEELRKKFGKKFTYEAGDGWRMESRAGTPDLVFDFFYAEIEKLQASEDELCLKVQKEQDEAVRIYNEGEERDKMRLDKISHLHSTLEAADEVIEASGDLSTYNTHHSIVEKYKDKLNAYHQLKTKSQS